MAYKQMTKKEFNLFIKHVKKWIHKLGVTDFEVSVHRGDIAESSACETTYNSQNRWAYVNIDSDLENCSSRNLELVAIHEMLELVLADMRDALGVYYSDEVTDKHVHRAIRRIENALK